MNTLVWIGIGLLTFAILLGKFGVWQARKQAIKYRPYDVRTDGDRARLVERETAGAAGLNQGTRRNKQ